METPVLSAVNISKAFHKAEASHPIFDNLSVTLFEGDFTAIMGPSGAGKSTLLYALSGMDSISSGQILYNGNEISRLNGREMAHLRSHDFGFVFQQAHLVSNLTLFENVSVAGYVSKTRTPAQVRERAKALFEQMNVDDAMNRLPSQVSGGEAQRAAVARAIINNPSILFADEPTGALNKHNTAEVLSLLCKLNQDGQTILMVTHDPRAAIRANRILYLEDGSITGEKRLPPYTDETAKARENELTAWLMDLAW